MTHSPSIAPARLALGAAVVALAACTGGDAGLGSTAQAPLPVLSGASLLDLLAAGPEAIAHSGTRRVEVFDHANNGESSVAYIEAIAVDSLGRFSLAPVEAVTPMLPDEETFFALQAARAGFNFRYRDFRVRDEQALLQNFRLIVPQVPPMTLLGRSCFEVLVDALDPTAIDFHLIVDDQTGLVLASSALEGATGDLLQRSTYLSLELGDPADFVAHEPTNQEQPLDLGLSLYEQLGHEPALPSYLPDGFSLSAASSVVDPNGARWFLATYTNGVEPLFYLQRLPQPLAGGVQAHSAATSLEEPEMDSLFGFEIGRVTVLQGLLNGRSCAAVGFCSTLELQLLLESANL